LKALQLEPMHGFGISIRIRQMSDEVLLVEQAALSGALSTGGAGLDQRGVGRLRKQPEGPLLQTHRHWP